MSSGLLEPVLEPNLVLSELRAPEVFVSAFLISKESLLVVKSNKLELYGFPNPGPAPLRTTHTSGYVTGAVACPHSTSQTSFTLLVHASGLIEARNEQLDVVDSLVVNATNGDAKSPILWVDERYSRFFITWDRLTILRVEYQIRAAHYKFVGSGSQPRLAITLKNQIVSLCACWNTRQEYEEVYNICILSKANSTYFLEIWEELDHFRNKWRLLFMFDRLDIPETDDVTLIANSAVGFLCLTPSKGLLINNKHLYSDQKLRSELLTDITGPYPELKNKNCQVFSAVRPLPGEALVLYGCTNYGDFFKLSVSPRTENEHIESSQVSAVYRILSQRIGEADNIERFFQLTGPLYLLVSTTRGILIMDLEMERLESEISMRGSSTLCSSISDDSGNIPLLTMSGGSSGNQGFLERVQVGFEGNLFSDSLEQIVPANVRDFWVTKKGIFSLDADGNLYNRGELILVTGDLLYVTSDGIPETKSDDIILVTPVLGTINDGIMTLWNNGAVTWTSSERVAKIKDFENAATVKYNVSSCILHDGTTLSVVAWNAHSVWLSASSSELIELTGISRVSGCLVKNCGSFSVVAFADVSGMVHIYNLDGTVKSSFKTCNHSSTLTEIPCSSKFLVSCMEAVFLVTVNNQSVDVAQVTSLPCAKLLKSFSPSSLYLLSNGGKLYRIDLKALIAAELKMIKSTISSDTHLFTKHLTLQSSHRYTITSALACVYDESRARNIYRSELHVYDVIKGALVTKVEIFKNHPQALIADIIAVPFKKVVLNGKYVDTETTFAKQLVFGKCFLVALNFEFAEDDLDDNVLLFSLDELTGEVELQATFMAKFAINSLLNYSNRIVFAAGEYMQALQLSYSVKENTFSIKQVSEPLKLDGFVKRCFVLPSPPPSPTQARETKKRKTGEVSYKEVIGVYNLTRGIQLLEISVDVGVQTGAGVVSAKLRQLRLRHLRISEYDEFIKLLQNPGFLTSICFQLDTATDRKYHNEGSDARSLASLDHRGLISIAYELGNPSQGFGGAQFDLPFQVTGIQTAHVPQQSPGNPLVNHRYTQLREQCKPLFLINDADGGCHLVSTITSASILAQFIENAAGNEIRAAPFECEAVRVFGPQNPRSAAAADVLFAPTPIQ